MCIACFLHVSSRQKLGTVYQTHQWIAYKTGIRSVISTEQSAWREIEPVSSQYIDDLCCQILKIAIMDMTNKVGSKSYIIRYCVWLGLCQMQDRPQERVQIKMDCIEVHLGITYIGQAILALQSEGGSFWAGNKDDNRPLRSSNCTLPPGP